MHKPKEIQKVWVFTAACDQTIYCKLFGEVGFKPEKHNATLYVEYSAYQSLQSDIESFQKIVMSLEETRKACEKIIVDQQSELEKVKGVLNLKEDEYVQQVGTWKIIQRLEYELAAEKAKSENLANAVERFCDDNSYSQLATSGHYLGQALAEYKGEK